MSELLPAPLIERVIARYPLPLADAVAALVAADSLHEERDRVVEVFRVALRWLALLALAARGHLGGRELQASLEPLAALRRRGITDGQWAALLRGVLRGHEGEAARHPLPGLVRLAGRGTFWSLIDGLLEMRRSETVAHGATGDNAALAALLERRGPQLVAFLESLESAWDGLSLVVPVGPGRGWLLMGCTPPRGRFRRIELASEGLPLGEPILIDARGRPALALNPLALFRRPAPEQPEELFVFDRPSRRGVLFVSLPSMSEFNDAGAWPGVEGLLFGGDNAEEEEVRPYRGLESFGPEHASLFFGREEQATALAERVRKEALVTVTGPSGSGKTSLLQAGVVPRLSGHRLLELRPGVDPCGVLARKLAELVGEEAEAEAILGGLQRSPEAAGQALARWCGARDAQLLLLVDQSEELFTLCREPRGRSIFGRFLVACAHEGSAVRVVLVVREDFFARLATIEALQGVYNRAVEVVTTPDRAALARAVAMPAFRYGYAFEDPSLVDRMVQAAADEPSALALLQFCAARLWEARDRRWKRITSEAYEAVGGVEGALADHAERTLRGLTPAQQGAARSMLLRLVTSEGTRALCHRSELLTSAGGHDGHIVLERLVLARLIVAREEPGGREASLEIVHEALLRHWKRLRDWQDQSREELRRLDSLRRAAREWDDRGRPRGLLWRDEILAEHNLWKRHTNSRIGELEEDFLDACQAEESRVVRWRRGASAVGVGGLLLSLLVLAIQREDAVRSQKVAEEERRRALVAGEQATSALRQSELGRLTAEAGRRESQGRPGEAMALLRAALSLASGPAEGLVSELRRLASLGDVPIVLRAGDGPVLSLSYSADGQFLLAACGAGARAWSWPQLRPIDLPHEGTVWAALSSPDGRMALTASADRTASLWRLESGARLVSLKHPAEVQSAVFAPTGLLAATGAADGKARIFRVGVGELALELPLHHQPVSTLAFSPDERLLAVGSRDRTASLWELPGGNLLGTLGPFDDPVSRALFSPDGKTLALVHKRTGELFSREGKAIASLTGHEHLIHNILFSPDGERLLTASSDRTARLWSARDGSALRVFREHERAVTRAVFSPDGRTVATASMDGSVRLFDAETGGLLRRFRGPVGGVGALAFSPDGKRLVAGARDESGQVFLWDLHEGIAALPLRGHSDDIHALAFSPDGSLLATASYERVARLWSVASGKLSHTLAEHEGYVPAFAFSPDGRSLATASVDRFLRVYEASSGKLLSRFHGHEGAPFGLAFSIDGKRLASLADDGRVRFFEQDPEPIQVLPAAAGYAEATAACPGFLAAGANDGSASVWEVGQGSLLRSFRGHEGAVLAVTLSRSGHLLVTGASDQRAMLWDVRTGARLASFEGHTGPVLAVALSPDGALLATGSTDRTVRLWQTSSGKSIAVLGGHEDKISALAFHPEGKLLASASHDDTARLWPIAAILAGRGEPGARGNLRVCRDDGEVVSVLPMPPASSVWAPPESCAAR